MQKRKDRIEMRITKADIITVIIAVAIVASSLCIIKPTIVSGESMEPTLQDNNYLILNRLAYRNDTPERGDIIVFPGEDCDRLFIKRVIAVGGDTLQIDGDDVVLNGDILDEPYINISEDMYDENGEWVVPEGCVFAMGDNRGNSHDSRDDSLGFVPVSDIMGKVMIRLFPPSELGRID